MIFNAKALAEHLEQATGTKNSYIYHRILRAMEGNPHGLTRGDVAILKKFIKTSTDKFCKQLDS